MSSPSQAGCIFFSKVTDKLHVCATMGLDRDWQLKAMDYVVLIFHRFIHCLQRYLCVMDVIVITAGLFFQLQSTYRGIEIWVAFGTGNFFRHLHLTRFVKLWVNSSAKPCLFIIHSQVVIQHSNFLEKL